ncbi:MAG: hypothetical protein LBI48_02085 [Burkholderiaceae bacterium]|jgi:hypothetical protein|nr:hypothetical protein [Burkholderiaceae bacterium]
MTDYPGWVTALATAVTATLMYSEHLRSRPYAKCFVVKIKRDGWIVLCVNVYGGAHFVRVVKISCKGALLSHSDQRYAPATATVHHAHDAGLSSLDCDVDVEPARVSTEPASFTVMVKVPQSVERIDFALSIRSRWVRYKISAHARFDSDDTSKAA